MEQLVLGWSMRLAWKFDNMPIYKAKVNQYDEIRAKEPKIIQPGRQTNYVHGLGQKSRILK